MNITMSRYYAPMRLVLMEDLYPIVPLDAGVLTSTVYTVYMP
jgi:hypothetical protein